MLGTWETVGNQNSPWAASLSPQAERGKNPVVLGPRVLGPIAQCLWFCPILRPQSKACTYCGLTSDYRRRYRYVMFPGCTPALS